MSIQSIGKTVCTLALVIGMGQSLFGFVNGQSAAYVLGQTNFTSVAGGTSASQLVGAGHFAYDSINDRLFVSDPGNNRVLVFDSSVITNGMSAQYVLGQPNFLTHTSALTDSGLDTPLNLAYDESTQRLFVQDLGHNRVMVFDFLVSSGISTGMSAKYVLGQPDFVTNVPGNPVLSATSMYSPGGMAYDPIQHRLFVSEYFNQRVLVYQLPGVAPIPNGMAAATVLGQTDFTSRFDGSSASGFIGPGGLAYDPASRKLFVATAQNHVSIFDLTGPLTDGMPATHVLGKPDYTTFTPFTASQSNITGATQGDLTYDAQLRRLFVQDPNSNRVLIYNLWGGIIDGMNAAQVLGQTNFTDHGAPVALDRQFGPGAMLYIPSKRVLFVGDGARNRVLIFSESNFGTTPQACATTNSICGTVFAAEDGTTALPGTPVELHNAQGRLLSTKKTDSSGSYSFNSGLTLGSTYYVEPVIARTQSAAPLRRAVTNLQSIGAAIDLRIWGYPATLQLSGAPAGSTILVSTSSYSGANVPTLDPRTNSASYFVTTARGDGKAIIAVPAFGSTPYYITCWLATSSGGSTTYTRDPAVGTPSLPVTVNPNAPTMVTCL